MQSNVIATDDSRNRTAFDRSAARGQNSTANRNRMLRICCSIGLSIILVGQTGCRLINPNAPPYLATHADPAPTKSLKPQSPTSARLVATQNHSFTGPSATVRGQSPDTPVFPTEASAGGGNSLRAPMQATDASQFNRYGSAGTNSNTLPPPGVGGAPPSTTVFQPPIVQPGSPSDYDATLAPGVVQGPNGIGGSAFQGSSDALIAPGVYDPGLDPSAGFAAPGGIVPGYNGYRPRQRIAPIDVYVQEARTGRIIVGGSVNSDLGVAGQLVVDERNFNIRRIPRSWSDLWSGRAFRGGGQNFRMELMPGNRVERYTVSWTERNLFGYLPYSLSVGGFYYTRQFRDWTEQRLGGRVALGYEVTKDLAVSGELRMEDVKIFDPRLSGIPDLDNAVGSNDIYTARFRITHDTRDSPFLATRGGLLELIFDQVFGEYDYSRGALNYSRYFMVHERPDGTGRHTIATTFRFGVTGSQTPIFENYFAGGYSTLRGFSFRGASPRVGGIEVGGELQMLGSVEYMFPLTADEMLRGVAFVDYGTVEQDIEVRSENFRVAPGLGLRVSVPALGPAPLAFDFAYPLAHADNDDRQVFSFFMGFTR